ncbi:hypothetical protein ACVBEQ_05500 [Nakamurella sp. GG22]
MRLLDVLTNMSDDGPFTTILATTFTFDPVFFVSTGVLPALAGGLNSNRGTTDKRQRFAAETVRDLLGNPFVAVLQGCPSPSGATPGWIDRFLWPTRRLGVLHAKCLLALGKSRAHVVVTSANLTEMSWCSNLEVAASWSAPLAAKKTIAERGRAAAVAEVADGIERLATLVDATKTRNEARAIASDLRDSEPANPAIGWSGGPFVGHPLDRLDPGDEVVAVSPFWAADEQSADALLKALGRLGPRMQLVGRSLSGSTLIELPAALESAANAAGATLAVGRPKSTVDDTDSDQMNRRLHAKQVAVRSGGRWRSYVGSANATAQGYGLAGRANIELGVVVEAAPLLTRMNASGSQPPALSLDLDDPAALLADPDDLLGIYARAFLDASGELRVHIEPAPGQAHVEVPTGGVNHDLTRETDQQVRLQDHEIDALVRRAEITVVTSDAMRLAVPIVLDESYKMRVGGPADLELDELLARLSGDPVRRPSDDEASDPDDGNPDVTKHSALSSPRKPVHRAREAIEVIASAEKSINDFIASNPSERLLELRLGGSGSIVDLARRAAVTSGSPAGLTSVAAAFVVNEIALLFDRLPTQDPDTALVLKKLTIEINDYLDGLLKNLEHALSRPLRGLRATR